MHDIPESFVDALAHEIRLRGVPVLRSEFRRWLADCGHRVAEDPAVGRWAAAWLEQYRGLLAGAD